MKIACLAWGSLVWDPRTLPCAGPFYEDGPSLPIDFSRVSLDGRVTLAIDPAAPLLQTLWVTLAVEELDDAVTELGKREKIVPAQWGDWVGRYVRGSVLGASRGVSYGDVGGPLRADQPPLAVDAWLETRGLDGLVWTALPGRCPDGTLAFPTLDALVSHLASLKGDARTRAEEYIRRAPSCVRTPRRARFESEFGWLPLPASSVSADGENA